MASTRVTSSTNAVFSGPGDLKSLAVEGGAGAGSVTLYDAVTQAGTVIIAPPVPASSTVEVVWDRKRFSTGLSITLTSVTAAVLEWY